MLIIIDQVPWIIQLLKSEKLDDLLLRTGKTDHLALGIHPIGFIRFIRFCPRRLQDRDLAE